MTKPSAPRRHLPTSPFKPPAVPVVKHFALGDRVTHDRYGLGRIIGVEDGIAMLVDFGSREARIVSPYTGMDKL
jgi:transcription elongation factor GreA-like protein